jgi:hypothetical protein
MAFILALSAGLLLSLPHAAAAPSAVAGCPARSGTPDREFVLVNVCGPRVVSPGGHYDYTIVLRNAGHVGTGKLELAVFHYDPLTRSSSPYRESARRVEFSMYRAEWSFGDLRPGRSVRVTITVAYARHKANSGFTELVVRAAGRRPHAGGGMKKDVFFK